MAHSPTQRTVHLWTLPHAPLRLLCFRLLRAVRVRLQRRQKAVRRGQELRDRNAGAPLATTVPLCVPTLVHTNFLSGKHAVVVMLLCRAYLDPSLCTYQDTFLKEADEDVGKMGMILDAVPATLDAAPAAMHISILMQARPATGAHPRAHRLSHTAPTDSYPVLVHAPQAPHAPYPRSDSTRTGSRAPQATSG